MDKITFNQQNMINKSNIYPILAIGIVILISSVIFKNHITYKREGQVKGIETVLAAKPSISDSLNNKVVALDSLISSLTGIAFQPDSDPLHTIQGQFQDINNDGTKEWIIRENWQGASGWSDKFSIYKRSGIRLNNIFDEMNSTSVLFFENGEIYKAEPYYEDSVSNAEVNTLLITRYTWDGEKYIPAEQQLYPLAPQVPQY